MNKEIIPYELNLLGKKHGTDKFDHGFLSVYDKVFYDLRKAKLNFLEIGIWEGASMKMWRNYFVNGIIYGADIEDKYNDPMIAVCNQEHPAELLNIFKGVEFDIIIDDGGHTMKQQQITLKTMFQRLKSGGIFVIEDLHTSLYNDFYVDTEKKFNMKTDETTLTVLKRLKRAESFQTTYISKEEFNALRQEISSIEIYYLNDLDSITGIISKK
jgi:hypothetical protein